MLAVSVPQTDVPADPLDAVLGVDEQFLELVCADDELLRAEFDAIIAEEWGGSPAVPDPPPASSGADPGPRGQGPPRGCPATTRRPHRPGADGWSRQRSPPRRLGLTTRDPTTTWMADGR
jgi:hypothetical protein